MNTHNRCFGKHHIVHRLRPKKKMQISSLFVKTNLDIVNPAEEKQKAAGILAAGPYPSSFGACQKF